MRFFVLSKCSVCFFRGRHGCDCMVVGFITTYATMQSVPITTNIMRSNPTHGEVYLIQYYVIKFVSDLTAGRWFSTRPPVSSTNKTDRHEIDEILFKVALNTIKQTNKQTM